MTVLTAQRISRLMLELLNRQLVLPRTIARIPGTEFTGDNGDTITVRVRQPRAAKIQTTPGEAIDFDAIDEVAVDVTVAHVYDATRVSDEDLTLNIAQFGAQILQPMVETVAVGAEEQVADELNDLDATVFDVDGDNVEDKLLDVRETLGRDNVPLGNRWLAASPEFATLVLGLENLSDVSAAGSSSALRDAVIGRYRGFNVVETAGLDEGTAVAYHSSGFVWGNRAPVRPPGAADAAVIAEQGVSLRVVRDFNANILSEIVAVSTFAGCSVVAENDAGTEIKRAIKLTTASDSG